MFLCLFVCLIRALHHHIQKKKLLVVSEISFRKIPYCECKEDLFTPRFITLLLSSVHLTKDIEHTSMDLTPGNYCCRILALYLADVMRRLVTQYGYPMTQDEQEREAKIQETRRLQREQEKDWIMVLREHSVQKRNQPKYDSEMRILMEELRNQNICASNQICALYPFYSSVSTLSRPLVSSAPMRLFDVFCEIPVRPLTCHLWFWRNDNPASPYPMTDQKLRCSALRLFLWDLQYLELEGWSLMDKKIAYWIERAWFTKREESIFSYQSQDGHLREIDFKTMTQTNVLTEKKRQMKHIKVILDTPPLVLYLLTQCFDSLERLQSKWLEPAPWFDKSKILVEQETEFSQVKKMFIEGMTKRVKREFITGIQIKRLRDGHQIHRFVDCLSSLRKQGRPPNMVLAWHGCWTTDPDLLEKQGLLMQYNSMNNRWGYGHYFSDSPYVSHQFYSAFQDGKQDEKRVCNSLFLCLLTLGHIYVAGPNDQSAARGPYQVADSHTPGSIFATSKPGSSATLQCDSVMGNDLNLEEEVNYCVSSDAQVLLLYRVDYGYFPTS